jgi:IS5 family transposase
VAKAGQAPDADAGYTKKNGRYYYGYKAHVSSDGEHHLIRRAIISPGGKQDGQMFEQIATPDAQILYGDKAYDTKANVAWLRQRKIRNGILKKGALHIKLTAWDKRRNKEKARVRANIERIFGHLKKWQGYQRVRYLGLVKNQLELTLKAVAYNLKRLAKIIVLGAA